METRTFTINEKLPHFTFNLRGVKYKAHYINFDDNDELTISIFAWLPQAKVYQEITVSQRQRDMIIGSMVNKNVKSGVFEAVKDRFMRKMKPQEHLTNYNFYVLKNVKL